MARRKGPKPTVPMPTDDENEAMVFDDLAEATDRCTVEPDGICADGYPSWLVYLGLI